MHMPLNALFGDRTLRALARANSALDTLFGIDGVNGSAVCRFVRGFGNSVDGTVLRANRATDTLGGIDLVADERFAHAGGALAVAVRLILVAEISQRREHGVGRGLSESA